MQQQAEKKNGYELQLHSMDKKNEIEIYHEEKKNDLPFPCKLTVNLIITRLDYFLCTSIVMCALKKSLSFEHAIHTWKRVFILATPTEIGF